MNNQTKLKVFSGIKPSGDLHIGNYLGAVKQWLDLQKEYECIFCVVDYHAITVKQDPAVLNKKIVEIAKIFLASGIDPKKSLIFKQSDISSHTELGWILNCVARTADLDKMTQFKDKAEDNKETVSVGLYDYPVLMAADILLYNTDIVPVGDDQLQHVELARTLARRFNSQFGETFKIPVAKLQKQGARIMGLCNPAKKMSKSDASDLNYIAMSDDPEKAAKKILKAVTDSRSTIKFDLKNKPAISNLLVIYSLLADKSISTLEKEYIGKQYGDFKKDLANVVKEFLINFQSRYNKITDKEILNLFSKNAKKLETLSQKTLNLVKERIGVK